MTDALTGIKEHEFLEEHERLEDVLKANSYSRKREMTDKIQFKNRLLDLFEIALLHANENQKLQSAILGKIPQIINKVCLSTKYNYLNTSKIIVAIQRFTKELNEESLLNNYKQVDEVIKTIFNIMVYKKSKQNLKPLLQMVLYLVTSGTKKIEDIVVKNMNILMNFIQRGKNIDKILFSFEKLLNSSESVFKLKFEELLNVLAKTKNKFFIEHFISYCSSYFKKSKIEAKGEFGEILDRHVLSIYNNLKEHQLIGEKQKKAKKVENGFKGFIESFKNEEACFNNIDLCLKKMKEVVDN